MSNSIDDQIKRAKETLKEELPEGNWVLQYNVFPERTELNLAPVNWPLSFKNTGGAYFIVMDGEGQFGMGDTANEAVAMLMWQRKTGQKENRTK